MALLDIIQNACLEIGILSPSYVIGNPDAQIRQMLALANREGKELASYPVKDNCWSFLQKPYLFDTYFVQYTASTIINSNVLTMPSTTGVQIGFGVTGNNLPNACVVTAVTPTTVTLDSVQIATATSSDSYYFSQIAYPMPSDYDHSVNQTFWDRNFRWQMLGPLSAQEWQVLKSGIAPTGPRIRFRIEGDLIYIDPYPASVTTLAFEYISNAWCQSASGSPQTKWILDTDTPILNEDLMTLGVIWRWREKKGLAYENDYQIYQRKLERTASRDGASRTLLMNRRYLSPPLMSMNQIPDTGYGGIGS